ncbi:unnamed protein product, partial [Larinioides sclopetarius]
MHTPRSQEILYFKLPPKNQVLDEDSATDESFHDTENTYIGGLSSSFFNFKILGSGYCSSMSHFAITSEVRERPLIEVTWFQLSWMKRLGRFLRIASQISKMLLQEVAISFTPFQRMSEQNSLRIPRY